MKYYTQAQIDNIKRNRPNAFEHDPLCGLMVNTSTGWSGSPYPHSREMVRIVDDSGNVLPGQESAVSLLLDAKRATLNGLVEAGVSPARAADMIDRGTV